MTLPSHILAPLVAAGETILARYAMSMDEGYGVPLRAVELMSALDAAERAILEVQ